MDYFETKAAKTPVAPADQNALKTAKPQVAAEPDTLRTAKPQAAADQNALKTAKPQAAAEPPAQAKPGRTSSGLTIDEVFCPADAADPFDTVSWDAADGGHQGRRGRGRFRAARLRGALDVVAVGHQRRGQQVFLRRGQYGRAREERAAIDPSGLPDDCRLGLEGRIFRLAGRCPAFLSRPRLVVPAPMRLVQFAGLVQRGVVSPVRREGGDVQLALGRRVAVGRAAAEPLRISPGVGLLHPERARQHGRHHGACPQRGDALQVRLGHGDGPVESAVAPGEALRRGQAVGAIVVHAGVRPDRGGGQERGQDPPGRQDAIAEGLASRHHGVHPLQAP